MSTPTELLLQWRKAKGLNQERAGGACGVARITWWRWENGHSKVALENLANVETVTGISRSVLRPDLATMFQAAE